MMELIQKKRPQWKNLNLERAKQEKTRI